MIIKLVTSVLLPGHFSFIFRFSFSLFSLHLLSSVKRTENKERKESVCSLIVEVKMKGLKRGRKGGKRKMEVRGEREGQQGEEEP